MGRPLRVVRGGFAYHVLNRANSRLTIFESAGDYAAWERVLEEAVERYATRVLSYAAMPNHWHLVLWPRKDGELSQFVGWITLTHTQRWHAHRDSIGSGHLYQGRFKSFVIQTDDHLYRVCRYVERNPLRASLVKRAEAWQWSSLWRRFRGSPEQRKLLAEWPAPRPRNWCDYVNRAETESELIALRRSLQRGVPYGQSEWTDSIIRKFGLQNTLRPRGRPRKHDKGV